ncbi:hypothetical protein Tco_0370931 [Tanacetum coccineum]
MASPLPLVASTNSELNLKAIFQPRCFWDAANNQRMASAFPCVDPISMAQESTSSEQTRGAVVWIIVERIRGAVLGND